MKKGFFLSIFILISFLSLAQVQRATPAIKTPDSTIKTNTAADNNKMNRKKMMRDLDLTKEQKIKMKEIQQSGKTKKEAIESDDKLSDAEKKTKLKALQKEQAQSTMQVLNPEQREKMKSARMQMRKQQKENINQD